MRDELRLCGGAGGEVQEQQILGTRRRLRRELRDGGVRAIVPHPALHASSHGDPQRRTGNPAKRPARPASVTIAFTWPRSRRSRRSSRSSSVVAGIMTAPSLMAASIVSHSGRLFGSMMSRRSRAPRPSEAKKFATCAERRASSENVSD